MANQTKAFKVGAWLRRKVQEGATKGKVLLDSSIEAGKDFTAGIMGDEAEPTKEETKVDSEAGKGSQ